MLVAVRTFTDLMRTIVTMPAFPSLKHGVVCAYALPVISRFIPDRSRRNIN